MACAAYDLACTWPRAGCTACSMCEDTILGLETTARYRPENVPPARRQWGWRQASPSVIPSDRSHLKGHGLAPASLWRWDAVVQALLLKSQHRSTNNLEFLRCLHYANRRSIEWRQAPWT